MIRGTTTGRASESGREARPTLVLNNSEGVLDIVLGDDSGILCAQTWHAPTRGAEILTPALNHMLAGLRMRPADIERLACVRGPGSFTGVRLILAAAAALRRTCGMLLAGLDYMQALAMSAQNSLSPHAPPLGHIWALMHARRDLVHCQRFIPGPMAQAVEPVELLSPVDAAVRIAHSPPGSVMLGSGIRRNASSLAGLSVTALPHIRPSAGDLWQMAEQARYVDADIEPLYVRPCDAVDSLTAEGRARLAQLLASSDTRA